MFERLVEAKHYDPSAMVSESVTTEDGQYQYWRESIPEPYSRGFFRYTCICGKSFRNPEAYELHYRKASYEEKEVKNRGLQ